MKSIVKIALGITLAFILLIGGCAALIGGVASTDDGKTYAEEQTEKREAEPTKTATVLPDVETESASPTPKPKPTKTAPPMTASQENAIATAESYLSFMAFSRTGLIEQLEYEGFPTADATFAVDQLTVSWSEQAAASAESYLKTSAFSRVSLIDQLIYEGFTRQQAVYGVNKTGL